MDRDTGNQMKLRTITIKWELWLKSGSSETEFRITGDVD
jgi:hypothetical protein